MHRRSRIRFERQPDAGLDAPTAPLQSDSAAGNLGERPRNHWVREACAVLAIAVVGLVARLWFVTVFPTQPVSDFANLLKFAESLRNGLLTPGNQWFAFNPGMPMLLSGLLALLPGSPDEVARLSTAVVTGLVGLLPMVLWRGVAPLWVRVTAGAFLALWPGQVVFSGVVSQDNWVLLPVVALACLAVRAIVEERFHPAAGALLVGLAYAIRQEMLVVTLPLGLAASGALHGGARRMRGAVWFVSVLATILVAFAVQRGLATGRYALTTEHTGVSILGSFVPGAGLGWISPGPHAKAKDPAIMDSPPRLRREALRLAVAEARRRPAFHLVRSLSSVIVNLTGGEVDNLYWSLTQEDVLPLALRERGRRAAQLLRRPLQAETLAIHALFLAAFALAVLRRDVPVLLLVGVAAIKLGLHAVVATQGRYLLPVTALELLVIAIAAWRVASVSTPLARVGALAAGAAIATGMALAAPHLTTMVWRLEARDSLPPYRFHLGPVGLPDVADCTVSPGILNELSATRAGVVFVRPDPDQGDRVHAECAVTAPADSRLELRVINAYMLGGIRGRMIQRVMVDGNEVLSHDVADKASAPTTAIPVPPGRRSVFVLETVERGPDVGWWWGTLCPLRFEFARAEGGHGA
jgi:hypothetical protein